MSNSVHSPGGRGGSRLRAPASSRERMRAFLRRDGQELPLLDATVLDDLEEQLERTDLARNFANDYAALWEQRQRCLADAVERQDPAAALDAVISLKVSSAMVGGLRLVRIAETLEATIRDGDLHDGGALVAKAAKYGSATVKELQLRYAGNAG